MRIIKGKHQRRIIHVPNGLPVRPTTDLAKESLFNILNNDIDFDGMRVLDLFAGTGNISYELVSRGCASVLAVDQNPKCTHFIADTAKLLSMSNLNVVRADVFKFLKAQKLPFDLIFADPPYDMEVGLFHEIVDIIFEKNLIKPEGTLVIEHSKVVSYIDHPHIFDERRYGKVHFSFFSPEI